MTSLIYQAFREFCLSSNSTVAHQSKGSCGGKEEHVPLGRQIEISGLQVQFARAAPGNSGSSSSPRCVCLRITVLSFLTINKHKEGNPSSVSPPGTRTETNFLLQVLMVRKLLGNELLLNSTIMAKATKSVMRLIFIVLLNGSQ